jgi:trk system potassium uptake protein TrkH
MRLINPVHIARVLSSILLIEAAAILLCLPVSIIYSEPAGPFVISAGICSLAGGLLWFLTRKADTSQITHRDTYLIVTSAWLMISLAGALPYLIGKTIPSFVDALFEATSGLSTTGSSILTDVESLPRSILFWRSMTHWIGGIGIIVLVILVLPSLKVTGYQLFSLESSMKEKIHPRAKGVVNRIMLIYLGITLLETFFLLLGGMDLFDSLCHSFGTVATGGFSTRNSSLAGFSPYLQYVVAIFMILSATSYVVYYHLIKGSFRRVRANEELWFYLFTVTVAVTVVTIILFTGTERNFSLSFRHAFFQVASQIACSGFATTDYMAFPPLGWFIMFLLMFSGGSTGSTTGGIKIARHLIFFKNLSNSFIRVHHPNAVIPVKLNGHAVPEGVVNQTMVFISLYFVIFIVGVLILMVTGISIMESAGGVATSMANIGPGLGLSGNMGNFAHFNPVAKITMTILMIIGRLELFTFITVFTRSFRRS